MNDADSVLRSLPHALGPEKSVLSSMLYDFQEFTPLAIELGLTEKHFYLPSHQVLFDAVTETFHAGMELDLVTFVQNLLDTGRLDRVGGPSAITDIYTYAAGSSGHFRHHVQILRDKLTLRQLVNFGSTIAEMVYDSPDEAAETLQEADRMLTAIGDAAQATKPTQTLKAQLRESLAEYERRINGEQISQGLPTFPALDHHIKGLHPGRMYMFCAYPEGGKSTISSEIIAGIALQGVPCAYLPLEGTEKDVITRMIIQTAGIVAIAYTDPERFAKESEGPEITNLVVKKIKGAITNLAASPLFVRRPSSSKIFPILTLIRRLHRDHKIKVVVIDYAQRIKGMGKAETREAEATECSNALQTLAVDLGISIIVPSQLNADGDTKHGAVWGEDADVVVRIVQDRNKESETYKRHRFLTIDKDRQNGSGGNSVPIILNRDTIRFVEGPDETKAAAKQEPKFKR